MSLKLKYFVLNPESSDKGFANASRKALLTFATEIENTDSNPANEFSELANDLRYWVFNLYQKEVDTK